MNRVGHLLLTVWGLLWAVVWVVVIVGTHLIGTFVFRGIWWTDFIQRTLFRLLLLGVGVRVRVEGKENIPRGDPCVIVGNHRSYLDIPAIILGLPTLTVLFVAKRELTRIPVFGWGLGRSHHIKVDRGNREQSIRALQEALGRLGSGIGMAVFPEGTRSSSTKLLPFKRGGFYVAVDGGFPILPVSIQNSGYLLGKMQFLVRPGVVTVRVHPPVETADLTRRDIPDLMTTVRKTMLTGLPDVEGES